MARPREFDIEEAVTHAMAVFWEHGYDATTTDQLLDGMRLTRGSLYKAFGDKKALFLRALDLYDAQEVEMLFAHLKSILGLGQLRLRGPGGANDEFLLAATAQNLRKLAKIFPAPQQMRNALQERRSRSIWTATFCASNKVFFNRIRPL